MTTLFCDDIDQYIALGMTYFESFGYIESRCFSAQAARTAYDAGLSPTALSQRPSSESETYGYLLANGDITVAKIVADFRQIYAD